MVEDLEVVTDRVSMVRAVVAKVMLARARAIAMVVQARADRELAILASTDREMTGQGSTGRVGEVYHPILLVQPSLMPGTIRVFRDRQPSNICWEP